MGFILNIEKKTACTPSPCQNHGRCLTDGTDRFECVCLDGTSGKLCQGKICLYFFTHYTHRLIDVSITLLQSQ